MSKLIEMLNRIARGNDEPLGFGARAAMRTPPLALVCILPMAADPLVKAAIEGGADALILPTAGAGEALPRAVKNADGRPLGVTAHEGAISREDAEAFKGQGADFALTPPGKATLDLLSVDLGWIMRVDNSFAPEELAAMSTMDKVDAVAAAIAGPHRGGDMPETYTLQDMLRLAMVANLTRRPVLLPLQKPLLPENVSLVREAGAAGIIITPHVVEPSPDIMRETIAAFRQAIDRLPRVRPPRRRRDEALVPLVPQVPVVEEEEEI